MATEKKKPSPFKREADVAEPGGSRGPLYLGHGTNIPTKMNPCGEDGAGVFAPGSHVTI